MEKGIKIVTIGGGSSYTPELVEGFIKRYNELQVRELWLVDIESGKEKLDIVGKLAKRMVKKAGVPMEIHLTLDRREALKDADFVTTQLRVGLLDARIKDERIPLSHGVIGQETNGAGGMFKALRTIPVILDIDKDMSELCPNAWLINFTNPAGMVTEALLRYGKNKKVIGLCNVPIGMEKAVADMLEVDHSRITMDFMGLNHMVFGREIYLDGEKITDKVIDSLAEGKLGSIVKNIQDLEWNPEFIKALRMMPCPYHRYYFQTADMLEEELKEFSKGETRAEVVKRLENDLFELYKDENLDIKPPQLEKRGGAYYSDAACRLINSIYNNKGDIQPVNTKNNGAIEGIENDSAVEISCIITKDGPKPIAMGKLPVSVNGLVQTIKSFERLVVEAAVEGDYHKALLALTINPLIPSEKMAKILLDELLEAHKDYLPQFA
ncbi:6-phospho-beta-glucosidase [Clostridium beijerinckii]|jgi:Alpha-galactosidases/6-phospho-beta-glucosidases, family 4 of glycosyl hydrolases|uniref:6-phospho-beta-glucosidase n=1 Tax=Clostridium beijerinckii TaxID=1520 RepID=A0AAW3W9P8_CLOBE|nr:6-phospho-beta-glucosidase [Clostridium beijerinckii]MBC2458320.1 6-phospho-beta-glucosidase [Clostridium beijerinckii]MBC2475674.1 6-phospho-beta-glucosidase [Clostridium beijerinckii]MDG5853413.1 6-phospho-beta-glucosidase [Clostridium beijerinckii]NOV61625.1 6-phospho-beta-glucosidase [Clostridium beijerinckii]NOV68879.1 6-phospho-beta-glucosidase [Clostridium beijerinckii]